MTQKSTWKTFIAELIGTMILVFIGCGVAVLTGGALVATAFAFGLALMAVAYTIGTISGSHINPAVSFAMAINHRISWVDFLWYIIAQFLGAIIGAGLLYLTLISAGIAPDSITYLGQNAFDGAFLTGGTVTIATALIVEIILSFIFVLTVLCASGKKRSIKKAGLAMGLALTLVNLFGIAVTGTSVNPARSFGPALYVLGTAISQVWLFLLAPLIGAALAAIVSQFLLASEGELAEEKNEL